MSLWLASPHIRKDQNSDSCVQWSLYGFQDEGCGDVARFIPSFKQKEVKLEV